MRPLAKKATPAALAVLKEATAVWPARSRKSDGLLPSAAHVKQNPDSDHNDGFAVDLTHDPKVGLDCGDLFSRFQSDPRVEYLIFDGLIWSKSKGVRKYTGENKHHHHLHISIKRNGKAHLSTVPWFPWKPVKRLGVAKAIVQRPKKKS